MAFLYLVNCLLLTFAPLFLLFNTSSVHEYGFRICVEGVFAYICTTCIKLLLYATFLFDLGDWNVFSDLLKEMINLIDIYAFTYLYTRKGVRAAKRPKMLGLGLGWAAAEMILSHTLVFMFNASSGEFTWEYLQRAMLANCRILQIVAVSCLMSIRTEKDGLVRLLSTLIVAGTLCGLPFAVGYLKHLNFNLWVLVGGEAGLSLVLGLITKFAVEVLVY